jgi:hypothetical protein
MKTKLMMMVALGLAMSGCEKPESIVQDTKPSKAQVKESVDPAELHRLAHAALRRAQSACLLDAIRSDARETLKRQVGAGAAHLAKMEFDDKEVSAKEANAASRAAMAALVAEEDRLSKAGFQWEGALYSNVIQSYETEARNMWRKYELARIRGNTGTLHSDWLAFLKVTIEQIQNGDY